MPRNFKEWALCIALFLILYTALANQIYLRFWVHAPGGM